MRFNYVFACLKIGNFVLKAAPCFMGGFCRINKHGLRFGVRCLSSSVTCGGRMRHEVGGSDDDLESEFEYEGALKSEQGNARDLLYKNTTDLLLQKIYNSVSIQEVFNVLNANFHEFKAEHLTQTVFVLCDLKSIYCEVNASRNLSSSEFFDKLQENDGFSQLLGLIQTKIYHFNNKTLSYVLRYLMKLGLPLETPTMQLLSQRLEQKLLKKFAIGAASRFLETVFTDNSLKSYFMSQNLMPLVLNEIDGCASLDELYDLTIALNKLHNIITDEHLEKYKQKVEGLIQTQKITPNDYKLALQIIALLNYPKWREKNSVLISKCILLIKPSIGSFNVNEIILLYDVFYKLQEPGDILNDLQRSSSKHFHQLDDSVTNKKLALFSTIIYFAGPQLRKNFERILKEYVVQCKDVDNLMVLRKQLSYIKVSDVDLCTIYWDKMLAFLRNDTGNIDLIKLCHNYLNFNLDVDNYRHYEFEMEMLKLLETYVDGIYNYYYQKIVNIFCFVLIYGRNTSFLNKLLTILESNWEQLRHIDCLKLSYSLRVLRQIDEKYLKLSFAQRVDGVLDLVIHKEATSDGDLWKNNALLKSCVFKNKVDANLVHQLLNNYKDFNYITSRNIENITYCFLMTNSLIPEVLDNIADYIINYRDHVLGFNVGKMIYTSYTLGYTPDKNPNFFDIAANVIIRDQERMTGLALIHCALALCFFTKLPHYLIKSIFNVEFMDKLDNELQNCYSKDKYSQRVRDNLMQLNRAVCLDYPECNVPWFHQKFLEEKVKVVKRRNAIFGNKIREYLVRVVEVEGAVSERVLTPYGYEVDFVVGLDGAGRAAGNPAEVATRVALLLIPEMAYTKRTNQLKGSYQMKQRHLEILGYKVVLVKHSEWIGLFYAEDRMAFVSDLLWPKTHSIDNR